MNFSKLIIIFALVILRGAAWADDFLSAADFSHLAYFESKNVHYREAGQTKDAFQIIKQHGINCVRLRLFTSSATQAQANPYNYINNLTYTLPLAVRVKNAGLLLSLDFHYSDTWADPGHQSTPAAWTNLTFTQLVQQMRTYNSNTIAAFAAAGAMPDYVQVGNEITAGMLWPSGKVPGANAAVQWSQLGQLMKAAIQGIQDAASNDPPKIIVHIDRGADWATTMWYFDNLKAQGVDFDIIGESYYPFFHGALSNLNNCLTNAAKRYGKPLVVAETAFPWNNNTWTTNIFGFTPSTNGQVGFMVALAQIVKSLPGNLGAGVFYWGSEYQAVNGVNEAGFNTASFFNAAGNVLPIVDAVGGMQVPLTLAASVSGNNLMIQWPLSGAGWKLMSATSFDDPIKWSPLNISTQTNGLKFSAVLPVSTSSNTFYRLQSN